MGSGKSFLGKKLAEKMNLPFFDLDQEITRKQNSSINEIFHTEGEQTFRKIESDILHNWNKEGIIATGGGIVEKEKNRKVFMKEENVTVWLNTAWTVILEHLKTSDQRPVFNRLTAEELYFLWKKRVLLYKECADIEITVPNLNTLFKAVQKYLTHKDFLKTYNKTELSALRK